MNKGFNPAKLKYYSFMISLNKKCKTKSVNVKVFLTLIKHIWCDCKWKFDSSGSNINRKLEQ